jgi:hypothetical protein
MILDTEIDSLPNDPFDAFIRAHEILHERMVESRSSESWDAEVRYVNLVVAFAEELGMPFLQDIPKRDDFQQIGEFFNQFESFIENRTIRHRINRARGRAPQSGVLLLPPASSDKILTYLNILLTEVAKLELPEQKRDRIAALISKLVREVTTNRTQYESWMSLAIEFADTAGQIAEKLNPVRSLWDKILRRVGEARQSPAELPPGTVPKELEPPTPDADEE